MNKDLWKHQHRIQRLNRKFGEEHIASVDIMCSSFFLLDHESWEEVRWYGNWFKMWHTIAQLRLCYLAAKKLGIDESLFQRKKIMWAEESSLFLEYMSFEDKLKYFDLHIQKPNMIYGVSGSQYIIDDLK